MNREEIIKWDRMCQRRDFLLGGNCPARIGELPGEYKGGHIWHCYGLVVPVSKNQGGDSEYFIEHEVHHYRTCESCGKVMECVDV